MSAHWYSDDGNLYGPVELKTRKGQYRDYSLADARKDRALPSVTNILSLLSKPGLTKWQVEQGIKAAQADPDAEVADLYQQAQTYVRYTQDFGTAVHWWVNKKLRAVETNELPPLMPMTEEVADGFLSWCSANGYDFDLTEHRFASRALGYAGTADLIGTHHGKPCICDLKTQSQPLTTYDPEYPLQLSGYDMATGVCECGHDHMPIGGWPHGMTVCGCQEYVPAVRERISLIANRDNPGEVKAHLWKDNERYDQMWLTLCELWFAINQYDPREGAE